jgi:glutamate-1-semialdehyde aminotransferase
LARTVTGRETIVLFTGSYHGINDEVIVRGTKDLRSVPAAPGILANTAEHVLVLEYGSPEALRIIRERAHELAAVLVEPIQGRRPDFAPIEFVRELRDITREAGVACIFDEVVTGFRVHPGGAQALFGVQADIVTYGKVIMRYPIGAIAAGEYMDAIDGGSWQFGDASVPVWARPILQACRTASVALAATKAMLEHMKTAGPARRKDSPPHDGDGRRDQRVLRRGRRPIRVEYFGSL